MQGPVAAADGDVKTDCLEAKDGLDEEEEEDDDEENAFAEEDFPDDWEGEVGLVRDSNARDSSSHKISNIESKWPEKKNIAKR